MSDTRSATRLTWRTVNKRRGHFFKGAALWDTYFVSGILLGLLLEVIFDGIVSDRSMVYLGLVIGSYALVELLRRLVVHHGALMWVRVWSMIEMHLRGAMLRGQVSSGGRHAGPRIPHAGAAMARFRDDPQDIAWYADSWIDLFGAALFASVAVFIMATIDPWLTVVALLPVIGIAVTTRVLGQWVTTAHRRHLAAASDLTANLRDVFAAQDTIRLYDARESVLGEVARRSNTRARAAIVDHVLGESIRAASISLAGVGIGLMLLVAADDLRAGELTIGELALFVAYLRYLTFFPRMLGHFMTRHRRSEVAFGRMGELATAGEPANLLVDLDLGIDKLPVSAQVSPRTRIPLEQLTVEHLRAPFPDGTGVSDASFTISRNTLTVVTGAIGSGKTTLIRALLGLVPSEGDVRWNDEHVADLGQFMAPPHVAYLPQAPRLFSDTLVANVKLGWEGPSVSGSLARAGLTAEVDAMHAGTDTVVGPRGVRLSGGQRQRLALARALHRQPELLILDDLSSAVDADTELELWAQLRDAGTTVLAISNRPLAINAADQVLTMDSGVLRPSR